ncbi:MAG: patatin-like phospholipase family protein [Pseudomonadota bacterium]
MTRLLVFRAGPAAYDSIRKHGFDAARVGTLAGASGGAKWLALSQLDRVLASEILPRLVAPVHTIGTSIGAWRFACLAQQDPLGAIERFEEAYIEQTYSDKPDRLEITKKSREILDAIVRDESLDFILAHPVLRMHIMTVRSRRLLAGESTPLLMAGLAAAAGLNAVSRRSLAAFFERALFYDQRDIPPFFNIGDFPMQRVPLSRDNLKPAILATGSIPLVLQGVTDIPGAVPGTYRDGGVIDYHLDLPHSEADRLTLYLHFYDFLKPGWFDKRLSWRRASAANTANTLLVSPSVDFAAALPNGKIPDRHDFVRYSHGERVAAWRATVDRCRALADEFADVLATDKLAERLQPL